MTQVKGNGIMVLVKNRVSDNSERKDHGAMRVTAAEKEAVLLAPEKAFPWFSKKT